MKADRDCGTYDGGIHPVVYDDERKLATVWVRRPVGAGPKADRLLAKATAEAWRLAHLFAAADVMLDTLRRVGCQFWACPGPDKPFEDMKTCARCAAIQQAEGRRS